MKRSEMIELIADNINAIRLTESHEASDRQLAAVLLVHLEEAGIVPPIIEEESFKIIEGEPEE